MLADERFFGGPTLWISLCASDAGDAVSVGNRLADAFAHAYRASVLGLGAPIGHTVEKMHRYQRILGPNVIVVNAAQINPGAVRHMRKLTDSGSSLCLVVDEDAEDALISGWEPSRVIEASQLLLTDSEVTEIAGGGAEPGLIARALDESGRRFVPFANLLRCASGLPPLRDPISPRLSATDPVLSDVPVDLVISAFRRRNSHIEAFEYSVRAAPRLAGETIREAAPQYVASGMTRRMLQQIELLSADERHASDDLMRWWFSAVVSENRHAAVRPSVEQFLASHEAPELRALYAAAFPGPELLSETGRAVAALRTPVTLRMHGFALGLHTSGDDGIAYLMKALRLAEALADPDQVVAAATDIANYYLRRGCYQDGAEWASLAVEQHYVLRGQDELRRLAAVSLLTFARLLVDDLVGVDALLDELEAATFFVGTPTSEGISSTLGDCAVVRGDYLSAEAHYRQNLDHLPIEHYHLAALDLVPVLRTLGRDAEARAIGRRVRTMTRDADEVTRALGLLAYGLSVLGVDDNAAEGALETVCSVLGSGAEAHRLAQASIALARARISRDDVLGAKKALHLGSPGLDGLGRSGWRLVSSNGDDVDMMTALFRGHDADAHLQFLGVSACTRGSATRSLTLRNAECAAVIASSRQGLNLEQLSLALYGDSGSDGTAKARVSRLRNTIPLTSRPYKIAVPFRADFLELMAYLEQGRVRQALNLYRGPLLPSSEAPAVVELREHVDESLRQAVLSSGDHEAMLDLANRTDTQDLELLEAAASHMPPNDPQSPLLRARIRQIQRDWGSA